MDVRTAFSALLIAALGAIAALIVAPLLQYVLAAGLLAFVLYPAHDRLEAYIGPRASAFALTIVAILAAVIPILYVSILVLQTVFSFLEAFDGVATVESLRATARDLGVEEETLASLEAELIAELEGSVNGAVERVLLEVVGLLNASIRMSIGLLVLVFVLYYLLIDGPEFVAWLGSVAPLEDEVQAELFDEVEVVTWAVIQSHVLVALVQGSLGGLGFYLLDVPNVAFWSVVMIVVSFLPAIGVWLVWGPAVVYLWTVVDPVPAIALLLYGVAVLSIVDNYLRAIAVDHSSGVHPAVVLVGVIGGISLLGIMGLFLGPVLLAVFKAGLTVFSEANWPEATAMASEATEPQPEQQPQLAETEQS